MLILGIETSCDDTAAAVIEASGGLKRPRFRILSNVVSSQVKLHAKYGGVVPNLASREHLKNLPVVLRLALREAKSATKPDLIAVTKGPGLIPALLIGVNFSRALSWASGIPLIGVNHIEGHIYSNWLQPIAVKSKLQNPNSKPENRKIEFPAVCLIVSGGHTELVLMIGYGRYKLLGETRDDAVGEAYDKVARLLDLGFPGGPAIDAIASRYKIKDIRHTIKLPRPMIASKNYDFSFAGLKTAVFYLVRDLTAKNKKIPVAEICAEFQNAVIEVLMTKTMTAAKEYRAKTVMVSGGVAANSGLRMAFEPFRALFPPRELSTDNAAMIAMTGYFNAMRGRKDDWKTLDADANLRIA